VIKRARQRKKLAVEEVAAACNVSRSRMFSWEKATFILPKNFEKLSKVLGISIRRLKSVNRVRRLKAAGGEPDQMCAL